MYNMLEDTDRKRLLDILLHHPLLKTERKRHALLINSGLESLLTHVDPKEDIYDFLVLLFAQLTKNLSTMQSSSPWLVSLLVYLLDFSRIEDLTQDDRQFLQHLVQAYTKKAVRRRTRASRLGDVTDITSRKDEPLLPEGLQKKTLRERDVQGLEKTYLRQIVRSFEWLEITGLPTGIVAQSAPLDEVFIPLRFRPNRPLSEYPLKPQELATYYESLSVNQPKRDLERFIFDAEKSWSTTLRESKTMSMNDFWQYFSITRPVAVIQGYPGMGKSTLLKYLALSMARRRLKQRSEAILAAPLTPALVPFFVSLGDFARARTQQSDLTLLDYLELRPESSFFPGFRQLLIMQLESGNTLMLFDGLDEVSDQKLRVQVQEELKRFILNYSDTLEETPLFNRFIITTRVAGYDQAAFLAYAHYTLAELSTEQINDFLPRWCRAIVRLDPAFAMGSQADQNEHFKQEVKRRIEEMRTVIQQRAELQSLVENPLLLTLLALMQQNQVEIPRQRVDLYRIFTQTLLERRSESDGAPLIPETEALSRLGPIAYQMQEANNGFMHQNDVIGILLNVIGTEHGGTQTRQEVDVFLYKMRVHVGIFLLRAGDFYAFLHRTFQEYFTARYRLYHMALQEQEIVDFVNNVCQNYVVWREPFLLAVSYASGKDNALANKMMSTLITIPTDGSTRNRTLRLQIAVESLIEARPSSIDSVLEQSIAEQLLKLYEEAQLNRVFEDCELIENLVQRWLISLPEHANYAPVLNVLREAMSDAQRVSHQRATLTLIAMFIEQAKPWSSLILTALIPPLLSLAGLPAIASYQPTPWLSVSSDLVVADLAIVALSLLRVQGPAGLLPVLVQKHFTEHPEHLHILSNHSIASNTLLTPTIIPRKDEFSYHWPGDTLLRQWKSLRDSYHSGYTQEKKERIGLTIHQGLLKYAEEMRYPLALHILQVLEQAQRHPDRPWQHIWQDYLTNQMEFGPYISYQESALLWTILFGEAQELKKLIEMLEAHLGCDGMLVQRYAQRFLATLADNLRIWEELQEVGEFDEGPFLQHLRFWLDIRNILSMQDVQNIRYWRYLRDMHNLQHLRDLQGEEPLHNPSYIQTLQSFLFTPEVTKRCLARLALVPFNGSEYMDLLTTLLGRVLYIWTTKVNGTALEEELWQIIRAIRLDVAPDDQSERSAIILDILRYLHLISVSLPAHTSEEICNILQLAERLPQEGWIQQMCSEALQKASPELLAAGGLLLADRRAKLMKGGDTVSIIPLSSAAEEVPQPFKQFVASPQTVFSANHGATKPSVDMSLSREGSAMEEKRLSCDVCVVCALGEEVETFIREVTRLCNVEFKPVFGPQTKRWYRSTIIENKSGEPLSLYITWLPSYGPEETGLHLKPVLTELRPRFAAMTGICAGDRRKVALGDIIVAERAFLYDRGKVVLDRKGRRKFLPDTRPWYPHQDVLHFVQLFDAWRSTVATLKRPPSKHQQCDWLLNTLLSKAPTRIDDLSPKELQRNAPEWKKIMHELQNSSPPYLTRDRFLADPVKIRNLHYEKDEFPFRDPQRPERYVVPMASGSTVRSDNPFEEIQAPVRGTLAVDMEGAVFYRTIADFPGLHSLLVKGVSDYADSDKDDSYHDYASAVSAVYALCFIKEYVTKDLQHYS